LERQTWREMDPKSGLDGRSSAGQSTHLGHDFDLAVRIGNHLCWRLTQRVNTKKAAHILFYRPCDHVELWSREDPKKRCEQSQNGKQGRLTSAMIWTSESGASGFVGVVGVDVVECLGRVFIRARSSSQSARAFHRRRRVSGS